MKRKCQKDPIERHGQPWGRQQKGRTVKAMEDAGSSPAESATGSSQVADGDQHEGVVVTAWTSE